MSEKVVPIRKTFVEDYGDFQEKHTETRYIVVDEETGEVLDDAQGYGYKSAANAHRGYSYHKKPKKQQNAIKKVRKTPRSGLRNILKLPIVQMTCSFARKKMTSR